MQRRLARARQRPQAVHRQRLARAAHADLLARRLRRAARGRGARPRGAGRVRAHDARADRPADEARPPTCSTSPSSTPARSSSSAEPVDLARARPRGRRASSGRAAERHGSRARASARATGPPSRPGRPGRVAQIIRILLDNALTHTPEGTVDRDRQRELRQRQRRADRLRRRPRHHRARPGADLRALLHGRPRERLRASAWRSPASSPSGWTGELEPITSHRGRTAFTLDLPPAAGAGARASAPLDRGGRVTPARRRARWPPLALRSSPACGGGLGDDGSTAATLAGRRSRRRVRSSSVGQRRLRPAGDLSDGRARAWSRSARSSGQPASVRRRLGRPGLRLRARRRRRDRHQRPRRHRRRGRRRHRSTRRRRSTSSSPTATVAGEDRRLRPVRRRRPAEGRPRRARPAPARARRRHEPSRSASRSRRSAARSARSSRSRSGVVSATDRSIDVADRVPDRGRDPDRRLDQPAATRAARCSTPTASVIGINQQIETTSGGNEGVGFAVPIDLVRALGRPAPQQRQGRVRLHRGLHPAALPAARRQARHRRSTTAP